MSKDVLSVVEKYILCVIFFFTQISWWYRRAGSWQLWLRSARREGDDGGRSFGMNRYHPCLWIRHPITWPLITAGASLKKKKKMIKTFFFPAVCKSALNVASIRRASPSLQQAAGAAASICCGNEDGTEAKGKGYRQVGEEGEKNRWSAQERRSELEVEYWKEVIISKLICRTVSQAQHPQKKWVFKAAVIGPFKHTELLGAAGVGRALTNAQTVHWHNECKRNVRLIWGL